MVITTKSSSNNHPPIIAPSSSAAAADDANVPNFTPKALPSPWAQVVRGGEVESPTGIHQSLPSSSSSSSSSLTTATGAADQVPLSDHSSKEISTPQPLKEVAAPELTVAENSGKTVDTGEGSDGNAGRSKKPAWNKPSNGVVMETGPVMGAESWPALSESTKVSAKSIAESASKVAVAVADGSTSTSQGPVISQPPQRHGTSNPRSGSATNNNLPNRPRPIRPVGDINIGPGPAHARSSLSNPPTPPPLPPFPVYQLPPANFRNMGPTIPVSSPRDHHRNNTWDARPLVGGSSRRGNFGSRPRGDGSYHHNYSSRRDQDRGNYVNTRDGHVSQPRMPPRGILRHPPPPPPPNTAAFLGPQPIAPFPNPVAYPDVYYFPPVPLDPFRGMPFFPPSPPPTTVYAAAESSFSNVIVNQIDYYFSDTNLVKDEFLKQNMDEEGWVPITVIANFPRVKSLTSNVQLLLDSMKNSTVVDVKGDKLRRRYDWMKWLSSSQVKVDSGSVSPSESSYNNLAADLQTINLEETTTEAEGESQHSNGGDDAGNPS
ncbi:la-related protein 1C-like [Vicia villosa]|uniref:la-related protein 1C-like n=1 Tax=Vicia villosa TaxID=3911 RepID=UPI00273BF3BA|nr:la-related protein 1C-like [Vicia villosa]